MFSTMHNETTVLNSFQFVHKVAKVVGIHTTQPQEKLWFRVIRPLFIIAIFTGTLVHQIIYVHRNNSGSIDLDNIVFFITFVVSVVDVFVILCRSKVHYKYIENVIQILENVNTILKLNNIKTHQSNKTRFTRFLQVQLIVGTSNLILCILFWDKEYIGPILSFGVFLFSHAMMQTNLSCLLYEITTSYRDLGNCLSSMIPDENSYKIIKIILKLYEELCSCSKKINFTFTIFFLSEYLISILTLVYYMFIYFWYFKSMDNAPSYAATLIVAFFLKTYNIYFILCSIEINKKAVRNNYSSYYKYV